MSELEIYNALLLKKIHQVELSSRLLTIEIEVLEKEIKLFYRDQTYTHTALSVTKVSPQKMQISDGPSHSPAVMMQITWLFRELVRQLHPDTNSPHRTNIFMEAVEARRNQDIAKLKSLHGQYIAKDNFLSDLITEDDCRTLDYLEKTLTKSEQSLDMLRIKHQQIIHSKAYKLLCLRRKLDSLGISSDVHTREALEIE